MGAGDLVPIFGMLTGIVTTGLFFWGIVKVAQSQGGTAFARRIQGHHGGPDPEVMAEVRYVHEQLDSLRQELMETQERLDFAERLLAQVRTPDKLPHG